MLSTHASYLQLTKALGRLQEKKAATDSEWQAMVDALPAAIFCLGPEREFLRLNLQAQKLIGEQERLDELKGEPWDSVNRFYEMVIATGVDDFMEVDASEENVIWEATISRLVSEENSGKAVLVLRDITERVQLKNKLHRHERLSALGNLVHGISHKVRSNLFGITGLIDVLETQIGGDPELASYLQMQRAQSGRIVDVLDRVLEYGGSAEIDSTPGSIEPMMEAALAEAKLRTEKTDVEAHFEFETPMPVLTMDRDRLAVAFSHILQNAFEHSPSGSKVLVRGYSKEEQGSRWAYLDVEDEGKGIDVKNLPQVFEPFFSMFSGGHGLGLSIAKRIVEEHRGCIEIVNRLQKGCRVTVVLPVPDETSFENPRKGDSP